MNFLLSAVLALSLLFPALASAGVFIDVAGGFTSFNCTICREDGTWIQRGLPHTMDMTALSFRAGLGYRFNAEWSVEAHYVNPGAAKIRQHTTVGDPDYNPRTHQCLADCNSNRPFNTDDRYWGIDATVTRYFHPDDSGFEPFVKLGGAFFRHDIMVINNGMPPEYMYGVVPTFVLGAGIGYGPFYVDTTYYRGFGGGVEWSAGLPISKEFLMTAFGIRFPVQW